jgi:hypothetical protein
MPKSAKATKHQTSNSVLLQDMKGAQSSFHVAKTWRNVVAALLGAAYAAVGLQGRQYRAHQESNIFRS